MKRALEAAGAAERRLRHAALAGLAGGLALAAAPPELAAFVAATAVAVLAAAGAPRAAVAVACATAAGMGLGHVRLEAIDAAGERLRPGTRVAGRAHLLTHVREGRFGASAEIRIASEGRARGARLLARLAPRARLPPTAGPGSELRVAGRIRRPPPRGRARFDLPAYLRRRGLAGELSVAEARATGRRRGGLVGAIDGVRGRAESAIAAGLPEREAALARGMVLGQDERIDPVVVEDFRDSGLAHLLAVSGQNVMLLAALALPLLAAAGLPRGARLAATIALIALYVPLAGAGPSLQRAGVMGTAGLVALLASRPASRWYALMLAACVTLALNPRAIEDPGWQLSFAAVAGILLLAPPIRAALGALPRLLAEGIAATAAATLATAPLLGHHFGSVPAAGVGANVVALPLVAPIMWLGTVRAGLGQAPDAVGPLTGLLNGLAGVALEPPARALGAIATTFAEMPGAGTALPLGSRAGVIGAYLLLAGAVLIARRAAGRADIEPARAAWRRLPAGRRRAAVVTTGAALALAFAALSAGPGAPSVPTVSFLDVGQGDATLIQHPDGSAVLFDTGPPEGRVARLLRRAGVRRLSALVLTHASRDHHGGAAEVVRRYPIGLIVDGGDGTGDRAFRAAMAAAVAAGARRVIPEPGSVLRAGAIAIHVLGPPARGPGPPPEDPNPRGLVAVARAGGLHVLLSADAESPSLLPLALTRVDALKLPHHGSADPGLPELLDRLRPRMAAIEVGQNSYGHPAPPTLAALRAAGIATFRTDRHGTVRLAPRGAGMSIEAER